MHTRDSLINLRDPWHVIKLKTGIYTLRIHIEGNCNNINVTRSLTVSEKCSLNSVSTRQKTHFGVGNGASSVVVGMERNKHAIAVLKVFMHILNLICINVRH